MCALHKQTHVVCNIENIYVSTIPQHFSLSLFEFVLTKIQFLTFLPRKSSVKLILGKIERVMHETFIEMMWNRRYKKHLLDFESVSANARERNNQKYMHVFVYSVEIWYILQQMNSLNTVVQCECGISFYMA